MSVSSMIYFLGWVFLALASIAAVPVGLWLDKRKMRPVAMEEEPIEEEAWEEEEVEEAAGETDLEKQLRRLKIISESLSQEEMLAHAQATLELATILQSENRIDDADRALEILTNQPGIGNHYMTRAIAKHSVVLQQLGRTEDFQISMQSLANVYSSLQQENPEDAASITDELTPEEAQLLARV